jgi:psp operon transcriptional activator
LRAVEYGEVTRIGASKPVRVDVRIVAATNEHLPRLCEEGKFRADLLDRLSFEVVTLPPLRLRQGDVPLLAEHFGRRMAAELEWDGWPGFTDTANRQLAAYHWPGNVRELRNVVERAVYRWDDPGRPIAAIQFDPFASPWSLGEPSEPTAAAEGSEPAMTMPASPVQTSDFRAAVTAFERAILENALKANRFNQRATAASLSLSYDQLRHALKRHKLMDLEGV